jgi:hypothetical protein
MITTYAAAGLALGCNKAQFAGTLALTASVRAYAAATHARGDVTRRKIRRTLVADRLDQDLTRAEIRMKKDNKR